MNTIGDKQKRDTECNNNNNMQQGEQQHLTKEEQAETELQSIAAAATNKQTNTSLTVPALFQTPFVDGIFVTEGLCSLSKPSLAELDAELRRRCSLFVVVVV